MLKSGQFISIVKFGLNLDAVDCAPLPFTTRKLYPYVGTIHKPLKLPKAWAMAPTSFNLSKEVRKRPISKTPDNGSIVMKQFRELRIWFLKWCLPSFVSLIFTPYQVAKLLLLICVVQKTEPTFWPPNQLLKEKWWVFSAEVTHFNIKHQHWEVIRVEQAFEAKIRNEGGGWIKITPTPPRQLLARIASINPTFLAPNSPNKSENLKHSYDLKIEIKFDQFRIQELNG